MWRPDKQAPSRFTEETQNSSVATVTQAETAPQTTQGRVAVETEEPSIGEKIASELDVVTRRERELREVQDLALRRTAELRIEQLRRILEFMER